MNEFVTMLFGNRADFAIEADVEADLKAPNAVWGHVCVWCGGNALGNIDDTFCALYPAYRAFGSLLTYIDRLWATELDGLGDVAMFEMFDGLLYGGRFDSPFQPPSSLFGDEGRRNWTLWGCFDFLNNWGEQFDGYKSFIVCPPGGPARVLSKSFIGQPNVSGISCSVAGVITAVHEFRGWFEGEELRLREPQD